MTTNSLPKGVCVKVNYLRPRYSSLEEWCSTDGNVLVTRHGRVSIKDEDGPVRIFNYPASIWANPYKLSMHTLDESLRLYEMHLNQLLKNPDLYDQFLELKNAKELGCFCLPGSRCHRDIILKKLEKILN
jgi:hypothetical protein